MLAYLGREDKGHNPQKDVCVQYEEHPPPPRVFEICSGKENADERTGGHLRRRHTPPPSNVFGWGVKRMPDAGQERLR